jgi:hypothetical protein
MDITDDMDLATIEIIDEYAEKQECIICYEQLHIMQGPCNCSCEHMTICVTCFLRCVSIYNNTCPTCKSKYTIDNERIDIKNRIIDSNIWRRVSNDTDTINDGRYENNRIFVNTNDESNNSEIDFISLDTHGVVLTLFINMILLPIVVLKYIHKYIKNNKCLNKIYRVISLFILSIGISLLGNAVITLISPSYDMEIMLTHKSVEKQIAIIIWGFSIGYIISIIIFGCGCVIVQVLRNIVSYYWCCLLR